MIYTEKTKKAIKLCYKAHAGQVDKSGLPYVHHPLHLAEQMHDENSTALGADDVFGEMRGRTARLSECSRTVFRNLRQQHAADVQCRFL